MTDPRIDDLFRQIEYLKSDIAENTHYIQKLHEDHINLHNRVCPCSEDT